MSFVKGGSKAFRTVKCTPMKLHLRVRILLLMCIIMTCSTSLVMFHFLLVRFGDCTEFDVFHHKPSPDPQNLRRSPHWDYFEHMYCLHARSSVERWEDIQESFRRLHLDNDIHYWDAIMDAENGHRGAWMSHRSIAQHALDNNYSRIFIFEDDIKIEPFLAAGVDSVMQRVQDFLEGTPSWEVFYLSHNCKALELTRNPEFVRVHSWSTVAFALNRQGIEKLAKTEYDRTTTVDSILFVNQHAYAIYPMVIEHKPNHSYTINQNRTEDVNHMWRYEEKLFYNDALQRNSYACSSPPRRAWGQLLYSPPIL